MPTIQANRGSVGGPSRTRTCDLRIKSPQRPPHSHATKNEALARRVASGEISLTDLRAAFGVTAALEGRAS